MDHLALPLIARHGSSPTAAPMLSGGLWSNMGFGSYFFGLNGRVTMLSPHGASVEAVLGVAVRATRR
jgi:hypothetical protein